MPVSADNVCSFEGLAQHAVSFRCADAQDEQCFNVSLLCLCPIHYAYWYINAAF